jgi:transcriptional regulator with XRE-family HTH domain
LGVGKRSFGKVTKLHGRVAFLPFTRLTLNCLKPNELIREPATLGEHVKQRRLKLRLTQKEAARKLRVTAATVLKWEQGGNPRLKHWPAILTFLTYDPRPGAASFKDRLYAFRQALGWSQKTAAVHLGVDSSKWSSWEAGGTIMLKEHRRAVSGHGLGAILYCAYKRNWTVQAWSRP